MTRHWRQYPLGRIAAITGLALVVGMCAYGMFGPAVHLNDRQRLEEARDVWRLNGSDSYEMIIHIGIPLLVAGRFPVVVRDGVVTSEEAFNYTPGAMIPGTTIEMPDYTVEGLFEMAATYLATAPDIDIRVCPDDQWNIDRLVFDPVLGYISEIVIGNCSQGLLCTQWSDCSTSYRVISLTPLSD